MNSPRISTPIALFAALATFIAHVIVLWRSDLSGVIDPISALSRTSLGRVHTFGLVLFGVAHIALAFGLGQRASGWMWPVGRALIGLSGAGLIYIAYYFATAPATVLVGPNANDPLGVLASAIGLAMGALLPGLRRLNPRLWGFNAVCLALWLAYIPLILLVNDSWLGGYERLVGATYVLWVVGLASGLVNLERRELSQTTFAEHQDR